MTMPGMPGTISFTVVGTSSGQYQQDAAGNAVQGHTVHFKLSSGPAGTVFIPDTQWGDVEITTALVRQAAQHLADVNGISGTLD